MSDCPAWISRSNRCAPTFTARSPRTFSVTSARRTTSNKEEAKKFTFYQGDVEGKSNIEKAMDEYLRGKPGVRYLRRNAKGTIEGVLREDPPQAGRERFPDASTRGSRRSPRKRCARSAAPARWWSIQTTATFWRWLRCHRSIQTLLSRASRRRIGRRCRRTKAIRWSIARSARCRRARHSSSSRRSPVCGAQKISQTRNTAAVAA